MRFINAVIAFLIVLCGVSVDTRGQIVLQPGPNTSQDIWTTSVYSYAPGGGGPGGGLADDTLRVGGWGDLYYSLLQFNLSSMPKSASSVILSLYDDNSNPTPTGVYLFQNDQSWNWQSTGTGSDRDRLWWADQPTATAVGTNPLPAPTPQAWYNIDITSLYNSWQSGSTPNYGVQLRPTAANNNWDIFDSSRYMPNPALRPKITITPSILIPPALPTRPPVIGLPSSSPAATNDLKSFAFPIQSLSPVYLTTEAGGVSSSNAPVNGVMYGYYDPYHGPNQAYFALDFAVSGSGFATVIAAKAGEIVTVDHDANVANESVTVYDGGGYYTRYQEFEVDPSLTVGEDITENEFEQGFSLGQIRQQGAEHLHFQVAYDPNWNDPGYVPTWQTGLSHADNAGLQGVSVGGMLLTDYKLDRDPDPAHSVQINDTTGLLPLPTRIQGVLPNSALQGATKPTSAFDSIISPVTSSTGSAVVNGSSLSLHTGSPVWMSTYVAIADTSNYLTFGANFTSDPGADGLLSVYWDGVLVGTVDERFISAGPETYSFALPSDYVAGDYSVAFRLDPYSDVQSSVSISGLATGESLAVPEPTAMTLAAFGLSILLRRKRTGCKLSATCHLNLNVESIAFSQYAS